MDFADSPPLAKCSVTQDEFVKYFEKVQAAQLMRGRANFLLLYPRHTGSYVNLILGDVFSKTGGAMRRQWLTT